MADVIDNRILWIDLETTGLDRARSEIIEIGAVITDATPELNEIASQSWVIKPQHFNPMDLDDAVWELHKGNGLFDDMRRGINSESAIASFEMWVNRTLEYDFRLIPIGGSGVSHFDMDFLKRFCSQMFTDKLTYWQYDIAPLRRFLLLAGMTQFRSKENKIHRAMADIQDHIEEARAYLKLFKTALVTEVFSDAWQTLRAPDFPTFPPNASRDAENKAR